MINFSLLARIFRFGRHSIGRGGCNGYPTPTQSRRLVCALP
jgi:hypothetical protein